MRRGANSQRVPNDQRAFRQADIERIIRGAKATGAVVQIDLRTLVVTIHSKSEHETKPRREWRLTAQKPEITNLHEAGLGRHFGARR